MPQFTISYTKPDVFNSAGPVIQRYDGEHGGVTDGIRVSYSSIIRDVSTLEKANVIVAEVNQALVSEGHEPLTWFFFNHQQYNVKK